MDAEMKINIRNNVCKTGGCKKALKSIKKFERAGERHVTRKDVINS